MNEGERGKEKARATLGDLTWLQNSVLAHKRSVLEIGV